MSDENRRDEEGKEDLGAREAGTPEPLAGIEISKELFEKMADAIARKAALLEIVQIAANKVADCQVMIERVWTEVFDAYGIDQRGGWRLEGRRLIGPDRAPTPTDYPRVKVQILEEVADA